MDLRVWESGASATPPAPPATPSIGHPTEGDPSLGIAPTKGGAYHYYQIGEELRAVLVAAGLTPDHEDLTQLLGAMNTLYGPGAPGRVEFFAMNTAPAGYLKANGALISRTVYADLFAAIGTVFGVGDGATTFALPDLRGEFLRGWDDARGVDSGRVFGSAQGAQIKTGMSAANNLLTAAVGTPSYAVPAGSSQAYTTILSILPEAVNGGETRPRNTALLACIKF